MLQENKTSKALKDLIKQVMTYVDEKNEQI